MSKNDGGPAFPVTFQHDFGADGQKSQEWAGMSLRDYLAAHAPTEEVQDLFPASGEAIRSFLNLADAYQSKIHYHLLLAKARYIWADAILAERDK